MPVPAVTAVPGVMPVSVAAWLRRVSTVTAATVAWVVTPALAPRAVSGSPVRTASLRAWLAQMAATVVTVVTAATAVPVVSAVRRAARSVAAVWPEPMRSMAMAVTAVMPVPAVWAVTALMVLRVTPMVPTAAMAETPGRSVSVGPGLPRASMVRVPMAVTAGPVVSASRP